LKKIFEIKQEDIESLNSQQLPELLLTLVRLESQKHDIPLSGITGSLDITTTDGGADVTVSWRGTPEKTEWFPRQNIVFQCKATDLSPQECYNEILNEKTTTLKPQISQVFEDDGAYILFFTRSCSPKMISNRLKKFREAIRDSGNGNYSTCEIQIYDAQKISNWVNQFLPAIISVCEYRERFLPDQLKTWKEWEKYSENKYQYVSDATSQSQIAELQSFFEKPQRIARIEGLSGLGKTRMALEVFRPSSDPSTGFSRQVLSDSVVYIDSANSSKILDYISHWRRQKLTGILVVDNCDFSLHKQLVKEIEHLESQLSLLTLDYNIQKPTGDLFYVELKPVTDEVIKGIITQAYPNLRPTDIDRIVQFAQGFPKMAVLLSEARLNAEEDIGRINDDELVMKLLWGRQMPDKNAEIVITACALFDRLGFSEDKEIHRQFVAKNICEISDDQFFAYAQDFIGRGIIDKRHRFIRVIPKPLAITLAAKWWTRCSPERASKLINGGLPKDLSVNLCDQMKNLHFLPNAQKTTESLCGKQAPFGQTEILNSEWGSRIFRSLVEVNPSATINALDHAFGDLSKEEIKQIGPGRRNLVWALEKLCFWEFSFPKSARILLKFAVSETEPGLGNNATGLFDQLFHYLLSGTQASLQLRLEIIDEGLSTNDPDYQNVCIAALGHALQSHHFSRNGGVETQGGRYPLEDWRPKKWKEVYDYWDAALIRLKKYALNDDDLGLLARTQIENSISGMLWYGRLDILEDIIFSICNVRGYFWPKVLNDLKWFINHHSNDIPQEGKERITGWIEKMGPKTPIELAYVRIIHPFMFDSFEGDNFVEESQIKVEQFAIELLNRPEDLDAVLDLLSKTESMNGYYFGHALGKHTNNKDELLKKMLLFLRSSPIEKMNGSVLGGLLSAIQPEEPDLVNDCIEKISEDTLLNHLLLPLIAGIKPEKRDLGLLVQQLKKGTIKIEQFRLLQYGRVLAHLSTNVVIEFFNNLLKFSDSACPVVFDVLYMYTFQNDEKLQESIPFIKKLLIEKKCLFNLLKSSEYSHSELHKINDLSVAILTQKNSDFRFAEQITKEIVLLCSKVSGHFGITNDLQGLIRLLLSPQYVKKTWPIIGDAIGTQDYPTSYCFKDILGSQSSWGKWNASILESIPLPIIYRWCEKYPNIAPYFLAEAILPLIEIDGKIVWSPLTEFLLNNYGTDEKVLSKLTHKLHQFSWVGSQIPFYQSWLDGFDTLNNHKNRTVKRWADKNIQYIKKIIVELKNEEDEEELYS